MDDKFLYQSRPPVRSGFGENLYARISSPHLRRETQKTTLKFALRFAALTLLLFSVLFTFSQPVRAGVLNWIRQIAGFEIRETDSLPTTEKSVYIPPDIRDSLANILDDLPYTLELPAYVPDGFLFEDKVDLVKSSVFMRWMNKEGDEILMLVDTDHGQQYVMGTDAAQEVQVNGQPALLFQGGYDKEHNWDPDLQMINVVQRKGDLIYWLIYNQNSDNEVEGTALKNELIKMIGSIP
jgi:Domain of unknown function (DUF4367)